MTGICATCSSLFYSCPDWVVFEESLVISAYQGGDVISMFVQCNKCGARVPASIHYFCVDPYVDNIHQIYISSNWARKMPSHRILVLRGVQGMSGVFN